MNTNTDKKLSIHPSFTVVPAAKLTPEQQAEHIASLCRELYKTNEGPRLLAKVMEDFPNPRKRWNEPPGGGKRGGWGEVATAPEKYC